MRKRQSLSRYFNYATIRVVSFILLGFCTIIIIHDIWEFNRELKYRLNYVSSLAEVSLPSTVWNLEVKTLQSVVDALFLDKSIVFVNISSYGEDLSTKLRPEFFGEEFPFFQNSSEFISKQADIIFKDQLIGSLQIAMSKEELREKLLIEIISVIILSLFIIIAISLRTINITRKFIFAPLRSLEESASTIADGNLDTAIEIESEDEIGSLAKSLDKMRGSIRGLFGDLQMANSLLEEYNKTLEQKVEYRTLELQEVNKKLQEMDKIKTDFLSTVSHELRTPLALVLGFARVVDKRLEDYVFPKVEEGDNKAQEVIQQVNKHLSIIIQEGKRLTTLIDNLLDISKMEEGKVDWQMGLVSTSDIINRALSTTSNLFEQSRIESRIDIADGLPKFEGDYDRLVQVIINLITNAVKFTNEGTVICKAKMVLDKIEISVIDTGIGIPKADQGYVFDKFRQVGNLDTDKPKGTGLGLSICKQIVEKHGGRIWVESGPQKGSTFTFTIPCVSSL